MSGDPYVIMFPAQLYAIRTDRDGETRVTFEVSKAAADEMAKVSQLSGQRLTVVVGLAGDKT